MDIQNNQNTKLLGVGSLLKESFRIYKNNFWGLIGIVIPWFVFLIAVYFVISLDIYAVYTIPFLLILKGMSRLLSIFIIAVFIYALNNFVYQNKKIKIWESWRGVIKIIIPLFWLAALDFLITIGGFLPLIVPGIIISILFIFGIFVLIVENKRGLNALLRSRHLVKGNWWGVFGRISFLTLLISISVLVLILLLTLLTRPVFVSGAIIIWSPWVANLLALIITFIFALISIFGTIYSFQLFNALLIQKQSKDFNPQEKRNFYKGLIIWVAIGLIALTAIVVFVPNANFLKNQVDKESGFYPGIITTKVDIKGNNSDGPIYIANNSSFQLTWQSSNVKSCIFVGPNYSLAAEFYTSDGKNFPPPLEFIAPSSGDKKLFIRTIRPFSSEEIKDINERFPVELILQCEDFGGKTINDNLIMLLK